MPVLEFIKWIWRQDYHSWSSQHICIFKMASIIWEMGCKALVKGRTTLSLWPNTSKVHRFASAALLLTLRFLIRVPSVFFILQVLLLRMFGSSSRC